MYQMEVSLPAIRTEYYADRFLSYIFDLNIGLLGYIPMLHLYSLVIITIFNLVKKNWKHIFYLIGMVAMLGVFSFIAVYMDDNTYISAYSLWVMPMVICGVAFGTMNVVKTFYKAAMVIFSISITGIMLYVNVISGHTAGFNESSKYVRTTCLICTLLMWEYLLKNWEILPTVILN